MSATLDDLSVDPGVARANGEIELEQDAHEADRLFGATLREAIAAAHGPDVALAVRRAFTEPTRPATPARARQDRVHSVICARLDKIASEASK